MDEKSYDFDAEAAEAYVKRVYQARG